MQTINPLRYPRRYSSRMTYFRATVANLGATPKKHPEELEAQLGEVLDRTRYVQELPDKDCKGLLYDPRDTDGWQRKLC